MLSIIVAIDNRGAIGRQGDLLCHMPADLRHFKEVTLGHPIIMGSKTYLSFPRRPLPGRRNIVITRDSSKRLEGAEMFTDLDSAIASAVGEQAFILGGGSVYAQAIGLVDCIYLTQIDHSFDDADTFFPPIDPAEWQITSEESYPADDKNPYPYTFKKLVRRNL